MGISEKVAYLKGLMEGMKLDTESNEGKILSAMNHTMAYRINFLKGTYHSHLLIGKLFYYQLHRRSVIRHIRFLLHLVTACRLMGDVAAVNSDSFT